MGYSEIFILFVSIVGFFIFFIFWIKFSDLQKSTHKLARYSSILGLSVFFGTIFFVYYIFYIHYRYYEDMSILFGFMSGTVVAFALYLQLKAYLFKSKDFKSNILDDEDDHILK
jgi:formate hydrogenlyase subunit 3/multisubunit Na+/H+ antiporter MnhD subunit